MKKFSMIVAATEGTLGIGLNGDIPWKLPKEFKYFVKITTGVKDEKKRNAVIMGKKTWLSLPEKHRPLKNRLNIILSSTLKFETPVENTKIFPGLPEALKDLETQDDIENIFILGGSALYAEGMKSPQCEKIYLTKILAEFPCDVFFPKIDENDYFIDEEYHKNETHIENGTPYKFLLYKRKHEEYQYLNLLREVLTHGTFKDDRTGVGTLSLFGKQMKFDLRHLFPLLTTKRVFWKGVAEELLWFIQGNTNGKDLSSKGVKIWEGNGSREFLDSRGLKDREEGDLGPVYGFQWRHWGAEYNTMHSDYSGKGIDQLQECINLIKKDPNSRRIVMSAWNPSDLSIMALPPCHMFCQFYVNNGELSCMMYQRSCDMGLGVPFNIASYALLTCMVAQVCGLKRGDFIHVLGDTHIYKNHVEALNEQITRTPSDFPQLVIENDTTDINKFKFEDFKIIGYKPQKTIKMEMAV